MKTIIRFNNNFKDRIHLSLSGRIEIYRETLKSDETSNDPDDIILDDIVIRGSNSYLVIPASNKLMTGETISTNAR
jgi:hypothetical protein